MQLGFRVSNNAYFHKFKPDFVQVSVWHKDEADVERIRSLAREVAQAGIRYVVHPFGLYLSETRPEQRGRYLSCLGEYGRLSDLGLILHDETLPTGGRLLGQWEEAYEKGVRELEQICPVSIEDGNSPPDALWFWRRFANSIVFDIGHFTTAGVDSHALMDEMDEPLISILDYIHLHRVGGFRKNMGVRDHWALEEGCPELGVLRRLLELQPDVSVVLEVDGEIDLRHSLKVLRKEGFSFWE